ncbi:MAG: hypothetical protein ACRELC_14655 [Gemmatimonadota bacterium]
MARFREGTGTSLVVAIGSAGVYTLLAGVLAIFLWIALSIYAIVEMLGDGRPNPVAPVLIVVLSVGGFTTLIAVGIGFLGKGLVPRKRDRG